jgi:hypothetical protein
MRSNRACGPSSGLQDLLKALTKNDSQIEPALQPGECANVRDDAGNAFCFEESWKRKALVFGRVVDCQKADAAAAAGRLR